jgi:hypothetical protein
MMKNSTVNNLMRIDLTIHHKETYLGTKALWSPFFTKKCVTTLRCCKTIAQAIHDSDWENWAVASSSCSFACYACVVEATTFPSLWGLMPVLCLSHWGSAKTRVHSQPFAPQKHLCAITEKGERPGFGGSEWRCRTRKRPRNWRMTLKGISDGKKNHEEKNHTSLNTKEMG